jgi:RNA polymerase II-associated factor 1
MFRRKEQVVDASEGAQLAAIIASFDEATQPLSELKHPQKPRVRAVESYEILPDDTVWANDYVAIKYAERPSASSSTSTNPLLLAPSDERLSRALLHPQTDTDGNQFLSIYLPSDPDFTRASYEGLPETTQEAAEQAAEAESEDVIRTILPVSPPAVQG